MPNTFEQLPSIQSRTLGSLYNTGDPFATQKFGQEQSQNIGQSVPNSPHAQFGMLLAQLLQQYQGLGTKPFVEQELSAREEQNKRIFQTPTNLIGASPSIQAGARAANVGALEPTIQGAVQSQRTFAEQLQFVGDIIKELRAEQKEMRADQKASRKAPETLETDQGIFQWNPDKRQWETTGFTKTKKEKEEKNIFEESKKIVQQYKDAGVSREQIEQQYKDAGKTIPLEVQKSLDELYPLAVEPKRQGFFGRNLTNIKRIFK